MDEQEKTSRLVFRSAAYVITTCVSAGSKLRVEAAAEEGGARWSGDFSARYVENITQKTGSAKTFPVFVKMLTAALGHGSESVFVDLLTYADLEQLKARRAGPVGSGSPQHDSAQGVTSADNGKYIGAVAANVTAGNSNSKGNMKRYLILTYVGEYDRVHYPLPLACIGSSSRERPGRGAAEASALESPDEDQLRAENAELRRQLEALAARFEESEATARREAGSEDVAQGEGCDSGDGGGEGQKVRRLRRAYEELQAQLDDLQESHERLRVDSAAEIRKLKREVREGVKATDLESTRAAEATDEAAALREELEDSEQRLRLAVGKHQKEVDKLKKELAKERVTGRAMRAKIGELSSGRRAAPDTKAYQQRLRPAGRASGGRSPSSPSVGRRGGIGSASSLGQTRGVSRLRRGGSGSDGGGLADSSSTNRSRSSRRSRIVGGSPGHGRGRSPLTGANRGWGLGLGRRTDVTSARDRGVGHERRGRADSPRFPPAGRSTFRGGGSGGGGSRASSRGSSPTSSRGRSRSTSSRRRDGDTKRSTAVFDPTAYQREREERRRRMEEERRRRERRSIGYSPGRGSGRDSWIPLSRGTGPASSAGVARGRSAVRNGGGGSGYLSAGSQASRASSRGSSIRSGEALSLSGRSSDASSRSASRSRRRGGRSPRGGADEGTNAHPAYAKHTAAARRRSVRLSDAPPPPTSTQLRPGEARLWGRRHGASPGRAERRNGGGGSAVVATNGSDSPRLRPKNASSPKNYHRHGVADGANGAGSGRFLRLVRGSGNSSTASSREGAHDGDSLYASQGATGRWKGAGGPKLDARHPVPAIASAAAASGGAKREGEGRDGGNEDMPHRRHGSSSSSWKPSAVTAASEEPARTVRARPAALDGVVDHRARDSYDGDEEAAARDDAVERAGIIGCRGGLRGTIGRLETNSSGAFDVSLRANDRRQDEVELSVGGEGGGGGARGSQEWALASSGGSSSSQRSGRRRVELRTPAEEEEEAVRRSQEISSLPSNTLSGRAAEHDQGRVKQPPAERNAAGAGAGREITDIDRRLGELHEFLRKAKAGGGTGGRLPLPPPSLSRRADDGVPANGDGQTACPSPPVRPGGALSNSGFEGAMSGSDGIRRSMASTSEGGGFAEMGWRGGEEMQRSVRGSGGLAASLGKGRVDEDVDGRERDCGDEEGKED